MGSIGKSLMAQIHVVSTIDIMLMDSMGFKKNNRKIRNGSNFWSYGFEFEEVKIYLLQNFEGGIFLCF